MTLPHQPASPETIQARFGRSWAEIARLSDLHTRTVQAWLSSRAPQANRFEGQGVKASSTGLRVPLLNLALGCDFPPETEEKTIDAEIEAVKAFFAHREVPWSWWIGPYTNPPDVTGLFARHQLVFEPPGLPAMAAPLPDPGPALNPELQVWQAADINDLKAASFIRRMAFRFPEGTALTYFEDMADDWLRGDPARLYLARAGHGPPVAIGALILGAEVAGIYIMATLPEWGRRGLGKAVMARMVNQAMAEGHRLLVLTAGTKGYPLYRQFGFEHIFDYQIFKLVEG
jgi:GNAT superfamily N-acetyltransferase